MIAACPTLLAHWARTVGTFIVHTIFHSMLTPRGPEFSCGCAPQNTFAYTHLYLIVIFEESLNSFVDHRARSNVAFAHRLLPHTAPGFARLLQRRRVECLPE